MIGYNSFLFIVVFFGITFLIYSVLPRKARWVVLLVSSWAFYFLSSRGHIIPMIATTLLIWADGLVLQKLGDSFKAKKKGLKKEERKALKIKYGRKQSAVLTVGVLLTAAILLVCKYSNFFIDTANGLFGASIKNVDIIQPLGISFYTLSAISYLVDIKRGKFEARKNPLRVSLFLSFMLNVVEGPIARYDNLGFELEECRGFEPKSVLWGAERILWGLFKKVVVADRAAALVNAVFKDSDSYNGIVIVLAVMMYTLQLYFEFSGIMDLVCGLAEMLGIKLPENFSRPFFAKSVNEFWQRWHITLGSWLRDYVFYSISLSKPFQKLTKASRKRFNTYYANLVPVSVALFFVWFGNGFWHGSGWKYVTYGLYYYVIMMLGQFLEPLFAKLCERLKLDRQSKGYGRFQVARNFLIVNGGMLIFRADTLAQAWKMLCSVFVSPAKAAQSLLYGFDNFGIDVFDFVIIIIGLVIVIWVGTLQEKGVVIRERIGRYPFAVKFIGMLIAVLIIVIFGAYGAGYDVQDLIYANF